MLKLVTYRKGWVILAALLALFPLESYAKAIIDPIDFERIWLQTNQRNLIKRYHYYNEKVMRDKEDLYLLGLDAAPDKKIRTTAGIKDAIIDRMYIHYQGQKYLLLIDWFSAIPQPQETEGFTYGDMVVARTWRYNGDRDYMTLGLRQKSTPRTVVVNSVTMFDAVSDATKEEYSVFFHLNSGGYDLGTYYSGEGVFEGTAFSLPIINSGGHTLSTSIIYYNEVSRVDMKERYELSLDHAFNREGYNLRTGVAAAYVPALDGLDISNVFAEYISRPLWDIRYILGGYYYYDFFNDEDLRGGKFGLFWSPEGGLFNIGLSAQRNAFGDFNALVIRDETIYTFRLASWLDFL